MAKPRWVKEVERTSLISVIAEFVKLQPRNSQFVYGLCPKHNEMTPSFCVSAKENIAHCFGCGMHHYSAMDFLVRGQGMTKKEAFEWLRNFSQIQKEKSKKRKWPRNRYRGKKEYLKNKAGRPLW